MHTLTRLLLFRAEESRFVRILCCPLSRFAAARSDSQHLARSAVFGRVTYYRRKREYGGLRTDQATRLKDLEKENA